MVYPKAARVGNSPNSDPRRAKVSQVILHHTASTGSVEAMWDMFMRPNSRSVSANFLVAQDGRVFEVVNPDTRRAWTTGSGPGGTISPDHSAITLECMNSTGAPEWGQSAASQEAIAQVIAWAADRYGFNPVRGVNVRGHREMPGQSTACPGGMPMDSITARAREILGAGNFNEQTEEEELMANIDDLKASIDRLATINETSFVVGVTGIGYVSVDLVARTYARLGSKTLIEYLRNRGQRIDDDQPKAILDGLTEG